MIKSFGVTEDRIAFWVGVTSASFAFSQFTSGVFWGRAGDRFGRKPVLLFGLMGTLISSLIFGFSKSLPQAIAARCLAGVLNGNVGIMRTLVAEMVPEKELQPRAFSLMPLVVSSTMIINIILIAIFFSFFLFFFFSFLLFAFSFFFFFFLHFVSSFFEEIDHNAN